jgi:hypothetical protein
MTVAEAILLRLAASRSTKRKLTPSRPLPKKTTESAPDQYETTILLGGSPKLEIGDIFWLGRKCVITKMPRLKARTTSRSMLASRSGGTA